MQHANKLFIVGAVILPFMSSCSHVQNGNNALSSNICSSPEKISDCIYHTEFDLVSSAHGYAIYFEHCPEHYFTADLSKVIPRDQLNSDFAKAAYRNVADPSSVLRIDAKVDYNFVKNDQFIGGKFSIIAIENWKKSKNLSIKLE